MLPSFPWDKSKATKGRSRSLLPRKRHLVSLNNEAGVFYLSNYSKLNTKKCLFKDNRADRSAVLQVISYSSVTDEMSTIESNTAMTEASVALFITSIGSTFNGTQIVRNHVMGAKGKSFYGIQSELSYAGCSFINNTAVQNSQNLYLILSKLTISNSLFVDSEDFYTFNQIKSFNGGFINIVESSVNISYSNFTSGIANLGGSIFCSIYTDIVFDNIRISESTAYESGGGIYSIYSKSVKITNSTFADNYSQIGDAISIGSSEKTNQIIDSNFKSKVSPNMIYMKTTNLNLNGCNFSQE